MAQDQIVEKTLLHLEQRRVTLHREIEKYQSELKATSKELAKVEQAIAGLRPLGHQSLLDKYAPALVVAGAFSLALLGALSSSQSEPKGLPPASDLILLTLHEGGEMTDEEILRRMDDLGWTSAAADRLGLIRSYLSRLVQQQQIVRVHQSTYQLNFDNGSTPDDIQSVKGGES